MSSLRAVQLLIVICACCTVVSARAGSPVRCKPDAVAAGAVCIDKYEASVWQIPATTVAGRSNSILIRKVQYGVASVSDLLAGGAVQRGVGFEDNYPCADD